MTLDPLAQLYQALILEHDRAPRNLGPLDGATHRATADNPLCGDVVTLHLVIAGGAIRAASFEARGCSLSRAAASILTTRLRDLDRAATQALAAAFEAFLHDAVETAALGELTAFAGVRQFPSRRACATLPFRALAAALG